jgi:hypothetical protein
VHPGDERTEEASMHITLTDEDAEVVRAYLAHRLGDLSMEISHTDNPAFRRLLRADRDVLLRLHDTLAAGEAGESLAEATT